MYVDSARSGPGGVPEVFVDSARGRVAISDTSGAFYIRDIQPGKYTVSIRRIGFAPAEGLLTADSGVVELNVALTQVAAVLPTITVNATAGRMATRLDQVGFTYRQREGFAHYVERKDVARMKVETIAQVLVRRGVTKDDIFILDRIPVSWDTLESYPAELFLGAEIFSGHAQLPAEFNETRRVAGIFSIDRPSANVRQKTVLIWTFFP